MLTQIKAKAAAGGDGRLFGLILGSQPVAIDITDEQLAAVQAAVDAGSVEVEGFTKAAPVVVDPPKSVEKPKAKEK